MFEFKKILFTFFCVIFVSILYSQSFQKGNYDITAGTGIGIYQTTVNDTGNIRKSDGVNALQLLFPVTANCFITDKWAIGIALQYNRVFSDSSLFHIRTINYGFNTKFLVLNNPDDNVSFDLSIGNSRLNWRSKREISRLTGRGIFYNLGMGINHYFNNNLGFYFHGSLAIYQFNTLYNNRNEIITIGDGSVPLFLKLGGIHLSVGLCLKF